MAGRFGGFNPVVAGDRSDDPSCREVLAIIQCYVDCECDVETMLVIAAHLDQCAPCCDELAGFRWLKSAVRRCSGGSESGSWLSSRTRSS